MVAPTPDLIRAQFPDDFPAPAPSQAQVDTVTVVAAVSPHQLDIDINGTPCSYTVQPTDTIAQIASGLAAAVHALAGTTGVDGVAAGADVVLTASVPGTPFTTVLGGSGAGDMSLQHTFPNFIGPPDVLPAAIAQAQTRINPVAFGSNSDTAWLYLACHIAKITEAGRSIGATRATAGPVSLELPEGDTEYWNLYQRLIKSTVFPMAMSGVF